MTWLWHGVEGPRDIPQWAYQYLVTNLKIDPDRLTGLKCVERMKYEAGALLNLIRIFDPRAVVETTRVKDFVSLDQQPDLILYEGYIEKDTQKVHIVPGAAPKHPRRAPPV